MADLNSTSWVSFIPQAHRAALGRRMSPPFPFTLTVGNLLPFWNEALWGVFFVRLDLHFSLLFSAFLSLILHSSLESGHRIQPVRWLVFFFLILIAWPS